MFDRTLPVFPEWNPDGTRRAAIKRPDMLAEQQYTPKLAQLAQVLGRRYPQLHFSVGTMPVPPRQIPVRGPSERLFWSMDGIIVRVKNAQGMRTVIPELGVLDRTYWVEEEFNDKNIRYTHKLKAFPLELTQSPPAIKLVLFTFQDVTLRPTSLDAIEGDTATTSSVGLETEKSVIDKEDLSPEEGIDEEDRLDPASSKLTVRYFGEAVHGDTGKWSSIMQWLQQKLGNQFRQVSSQIARSFHGGLPPNFYKDVTDYPHDWEYKGMIESFLLKMLDAAGVELELFSSTPPDEVDPVASSGDAAVTPPAGLEKEAASGAVSLESRDAGKGVLLEKGLGKAKS